MHGNRILSNLLILGTGRVATTLISAVFFIILTRYLGPVRFGELAFAEAIVGLLGQVNALGMETYLIRTIARNHSDAGRLASAALVTKVVCALPVPVVLLVYIRLTRLDYTTSLLIYMYAAGMVLQSFTAVLVWSLQAMEKMRYVAGVDVLQNVVVLVCAFVIIFLHGSVITFAGVGLATTVALLALNIAWSRPYVRLTRDFGWPVVKQLLVGSMAFWAKDVTKTLYSYMDSAILGTLAGTGAVGFYAAPTRIFAVALSVPDIVGNATFPLLSRLGIDTRNDFVRVSAKTVALLVLLGVPLTAGLATFAGPVIAIMFGPSFGPSVPVLVVLSLCLLPMFLNSQFAQILTAQDRQWTWTGVMVVGTALNIVVNLVMIPLGVHYWHNGALGAATTMLGTELLMTIYGFVILREVMLQSSLIRVMIGATVAGLAQAGIAWLMGSQWILLVAGETIGVAVYLAIVIVTGALPRQEIAALWRSARGRAAQSV
jgi:O-antigen/teichoic acid export membrane protein